MTSIILVSHSRQLAEGLKELILQMAPKTPIFTSGGTKEGEIGTDYDSIKLIFNEITHDGALIFFDLGSSYFTSQIVHEEMDEKIKNRVIFMDAPFVEGAIEAAVLANINMPLEEIVEKLEKYNLGKL
jgi:dihydroxyacetone kinase phosphotransfer subunit